MLQRSIRVAKFLATEPARRARIGQSPHAVVFRQGKASLRHFAPAEPKHAPVFVCMPLINTWQIWDLLPGHSVVEKLVSEGVPVYLLDWGSPGSEDSQTSLAHYIDSGIGRMFDRARRHARETYGEGPMDAVGYCVGGTFLAIWLARNPEAVRRVALVCTPIDFKASGRLAVWARPETFPVDDIVDGLGNFPAELMKTSFAWLRPAGQTRKWVSLAERIDKPEFREMWAAMERWSADAVDFPGEAYREYVKRCYFDNALIEGGWFLDGKPVDLSTAKIPMLAIAASGDHIVPAPAAFALQDVWGGEVECRELKGGHVGVSVTPALPDALLEWVRS